MGRVSKRRVEPWIEERMFELFWELLATIHSSKDIHTFFKSLLSYTEQVMLAKRLAISLLLTKGYTYEEIRSVLKVSTSTVATVHKALLVGSPGYQMAIDMIQTQANQEDFWYKLEEMLLKLSAPAAYGAVAHEKRRHAKTAIYKRNRQREVLE